MKLNSLDSLARRQHGIVARTQTDLTTSSWHRAIASGNLIEVHRGVARLVGTSDTAEQRIVAAVLACGRGAMASHRSAALLHGIPTRQPPPVDVIVPTPSSEAIDRRARGRRGLVGVEIHRQRDILRMSPHRIAGIPCTNVLRTLVDLGAVAPDDVNGAVGHCLSNNLASLDAIETTLSEHRRRGRSGATALQAAIDDWALDGKPADSVLEPAMHRLITHYGLPPVEFHPTVGGREVDFRVIGAPIVLECDGWRYHGKRRAQFDRDRDTDAEFLAHGWLVLRFTYRKLTTRPGDVARQIRQTIERWTAAPCPDAA